MWLGTKQQLDKVVIKDVPLLSTVVTVIDSAHDLGVTIDTVNGHARHSSLPQWLLSAAATSPCGAVSFNVSSCICGQPIGLL